MDSQPFDLKKTLNLHATAKKPRLEDWSMSFPTLAQHVIKLVVVGTAGHPDIDIESSPRVRAGKNTAAG